MNEDRKIDAALKALTTVAPREGLEGRVLRRLAERKPKAATTWRWFPPALALGVFALLAVLMATRPSAVPAPQPKIQAVADHAPLQQKDGVVRPALQPVIGRSRRLTRRPATMMPASFPAPEAPLTEQEKLLVRIAEARRQAMVTPPALPPAPAEAIVPLTGQEKLLLAVAHVRQPEAIDALDPIRRAAQEAADDREFHAFVATVRPGGF